MRSDRMCRVSWDRETICSVVSWCMRKTFVPGVLTLNRQLDPHQRPCQPCSPSGTTPVSIISRTAFRIGRAFINPGCLIGFEPSEMCWSSGDSIFVLHLNKILGRVGTWPEPQGLWHQGLRTTSRNAAPVSRRHFQR